VKVTPLNCVLWEVDWRRIFYESLGIYVTLEINRPLISEKCASLRVLRFRRFKFWLETFTCASSALSCSSLKISHQLPGRF